MLNEHDACNKWRNLFGGAEIEDETLNEAQQLLDQLPPESPVRLRLANELDEIRGLKRRTKHVR